jgi:hypothetical protein
LASETVYEEIKEKNGNSTEVAAFGNQISDSPHLLKMNYVK